LRYGPQAGAIHRHSWPERAKQEREPILPELHGRPRGASRQIEDSGLPQYTFTSRGPRPRGPSLPEQAAKNCGINSFFFFFFVFEVGVPRVDCDSAGEALPALRPTRSLGWPGKIQAPTLGAAESHGVRAFSRRFRVRHRPAPQHWPGACCPGAAPVGEHVPILRGLRAPLASVKQVTLGRSRGRDCQAAPAEAG